MALFTLKPSTYSKFKNLSKEEIDTFLQDRIDEHIVDLPAIPRLAYLISGSKGDGMKIQRTLQAIYHPRNYYILHLDLKSPRIERANLSTYLNNNPIFNKIGNVIMIENANIVTYRGPTMVAETLHGAAILLKKFKDWDWFINLSASDYPLTTQDDILHVFSNLPRDLNFIEHTTNLEWKLEGRAKPIIIDPGLYMDVKYGNIMETNYNRQIPTTFDLFTGSAWAILSRSFIEYTIIGWDNLPRLLLMYYTNFVSSPEGYFHTVICNSDKFKNTTVNHDLRYIAWDNPPKQHPLTLTLTDFENMTRSGAPFARKFSKDNHVLDLIDRKLLGRAPGKFTPGSWCIGGGMDSYTVREKSSLLQPGPGAQRLQSLIVRLLEEPNFRSKQCAIV